MPCFLLLHISVRKTFMFLFLLKKREVKIKQHKNHIRTTFIITAGLSLSTRRAVRKTGHLWKRECGEREREELGFEIGEKGGINFKIGGITEFLHLN